MPLKSDNALKTDLYELTMAAGYFQADVRGRATFELFCHRMPQQRSYLVACGLRQAAEYILNLCFSEEDIAYLRRLPAFAKVSPEFWTYLRNFRFSGDVWAVAEGEVVFAPEPLLQVTAPIIEAQILETYLLSVFNIQSAVASKAARVVQAACSDGQSRSVIDFGSRRAHGPEAGILAAAAGYTAGCAGTSNVYAGRAFHIPVYGTMAHSWIETFAQEEDAFLRYYEVFPDHNVLLVDTYDTLQAVDKIIQMKDRMRLNAVRLDSGDLETLSKAVRAKLDTAGLQTVKIIASGNLNEYKIEQLVRAGAPIDIFGVGTDMVVSRDEPALDLTYKLVQIEDTNGVHYKAKRSPGKETVPGRKQVFRSSTPSGLIDKDVIGLFTEVPPQGHISLLKPVIEKGDWVGTLPDYSGVRDFARRRIGQLPQDMLNLGRAQSLQPSFTAAITALKNQYLSV